MEPYKKPEDIRPLDMPKTPQIDFTAEKLCTFEMLYKRALGERRDVFHFEGHEIYVGYAKYLIEYLKGEGL